VSILGETAVRTGLFRPARAMVCAPGLMERPVSGKGNLMLSRVSNHCRTGILSPCLGVTQNESLE